MKNNSSTVDLVNPESLLDSWSDGRDAEGSTLDLKPTSIWCQDSTGVESEVAIERIDIHYTRNLRSYVIRVALHEGQYLGRIVGLTRGLLSGSLYNVTSKHLDLMSTPNGL